jgi:hypothetical protein
MAATRPKKLLRFIAVSSSNHLMLSASTRGLYGISFYDPTTLAVRVPDSRRSQAKR